ncbi:hypothetical protein L6R53_13255 [Myxococcota bacterium]|nr:hypothetical protein [Myxococcota bacterium]
MAAHRIAARALALVLLAAPLAACEPTCKQTCRKLLDCEEVDTPRQGLEECQAACEIQERLYEDWEDLQAREALADVKRCVRDEECVDIAEGACYDPDLYVW